MRCRGPLRVPLLTARHRTARLQWARAHQDWLLPQWRNVLFSDESRFGLIPGTMTDAYYLQNITNAIVQPLRNEIGDQFIFMDDNARPHRTRAIQQALENENIARLEWPAMSPDMNPIEHVCVSQEPFLTKITLQEAHTSLLLRLQRNGTIYIDKK
nr:unnamed protein product [Callosobruchus chinensis]